MSLKIIENSLYKKIFKTPFSYMTGGIMLAILNVALLIVANRPWGVSGVLTHWAGWFVYTFTSSVENWSVYSSQSAAKVLTEQGFLLNHVSVSNIGIITGALLATLFASQFKLKYIKSGRQVVAASVGGLLMGYGARIAYGCNIGAFFSGISSLSLTGWVFGLFIVVGAWIGSKLLVNYLMG